VPIKGGYINGALFTSLLPGLQSSFSYEMQKSRFGQRTRRTMTHAAFAAVPKWTHTGVCVRSGCSFSARCEL
jgi:hypothetical protein